MMTSVVRNAMVPTVPCLEHLRHVDTVLDFPSEFSSSSVGSRTTVTDKCRVASCAKLAAPERHGHCQECFTIFYPDVFYREAVVERQISELSIGSIDD
ncbi:hypothetical protein OS493_022977 [Desmophyllum pertusum]|uniref:Uncharacterized protein n=1 Tax=Desmophyllum pertusum TaxID=174260 RepID=A0A9W9ZD20_9CNID|nr:hypothetical protein OS493_022977 [Desmophyllum pertusum]